MQENIFATLEWDIPKQDMKLRAITIQSGYIKSKTFCLTKDTTNKVKFQLRGTDNRQRVNIQCEQLLQISKKDKYPNREMSEEYKQAIHRRNTNGQHEKMLTLTTIKKNQQQHIKTMR